LDGLDDDLDNLAHPLLVKRIAQEGKTFEEGMVVRYHSLTHGCLRRRRVFTMI
jgi:hypothetical protein